MITSWFCAEQVVLVERTHSCRHAAYSSEWLRCPLCRIGQNHIYMVYIRYFWQGNYQISSHIRCIYIRFWPTLSLWDGCSRVLSPSLYCNFAGLARTVHKLYTLCMTAYLVFPLPRLPIMHRIYMVLANPTTMCTKKVRMMIQAQNTHTNQCCAPDAWRRQW
jgi:hypothetical protein